MAANKPYDIYDLLRFTPADFEHLGVRAAGDQVVVCDKATGADASITLNTFEVEALGLWITTRWPQERCDRHRPYRRGSRNFWSSFAECRCALVFQSNLLQAWLRARCNGLERAAGEHQLVAEDLLAELRASR